MAIPAAIEQVTQEYPKTAPTIPADPMPSKTTGIIASPRTSMKIIPRAPWNTSGVPCGIGRKSVVAEMKFIVEANDTLKASPAKKIDRLWSNDWLVTTSAGRQNAT